jgi:hypothetical protein
MSERTLNIITAILLLVLLVAALLLFWPDRDPVSPIATPTLDSPLPTEFLPDPSEPTPTPQVLIGLTLEAGP